MAGRIIVDADAEEPSRWDRFALEFEDGTRLALRDKRRLGRAILNPDFVTSVPMPPASGVTTSERRSVPVTRRSRPGCSTSMRSPASATCSPIRPLWQARFSRTAIPGI